MGAYTNEVASVRERPKRQVREKDMVLEPDPVWIMEGNEVRPTPFFLQWWQAVAECQYGDRERWPEAAHKLGYLVTWTDDHGQNQTDLARFQYDAVLYRDSLGLPQGLPLVSEISGNHDRYDRLWHWLLEESEAGDGQWDRSDLG